MAGRHDFSPLDRGRLFQAAAGLNPHGPPGPTPPPPLLSPAAFVDGGSGLASGLARQSLVELARANSTPGAHCSPLSAYQSRYLPPSVPLHSTRGGYPLMGQYMGGTGGAGGSQAASSGAAFKGLVPDLAHHWPQSAHGSATEASLERAGLHAGMYPPYLPLLSSADNMQLFQQPGQPLHAYHRIYDLHKEALLASGLGGGCCGSSSAGVSAGSGSPLFAGGFALPTAPCSSSCYGNGCVSSRGLGASLSATAELQEQARVLQFQQQQQQQQQQREQQQQQQREQQQREQQQYHCKAQDRASPSSPAPSKSVSGNSGTKKSVDTKLAPLKTEDGVAISEGQHHQQHRHHPHHGSQQSQKSGAGIGVVNPSKSKADSTLRSRIAEVNGHRRPQHIASSNVSDVQNGNKKTKKHTDSVTAAVVGTDHGRTNCSSCATSNNRGNGRDSQHCKSTHVHRSKTAAACVSVKGVSKPSERAIDKVKVEPQHRKVTSSSDHNSDSTKAGNHVNVKTVPDNSHVDLNQRPTKPCKQTEREGAQGKRATVVTEPYTKLTPVTPVANALVIAPTLSTAGVLSVSTVSPQGPVSGESLHPHHSRPRCATEEKAPCDDQRLCDGKQKGATTGCRTEQQTQSQKPQHVSQTQAPALTTSRPTMPSSPSPALSSSIETTSKTETCPTTGALTMTCARSGSPRVTSTSSGGGVYSIYPSTKPIPVPYIPPDECTPSEDGKIVVETGKSAGYFVPYLQSLYPYPSQPAGGQEGSRKVHATTFTPEVGTVHKTPVSGAPGTCTSHSHYVSRSSSSPLSSSSSTKPFTGQDSKPVLTATNSALRSSLSRNPGRGVPRSMDSSSHSKGTSSVEALSIVTSQRDIPPHIHDTTSKTVVGTLNLSPRSPSASTGPSKAESVVRTVNGGDSGKAWRDTAHTGDTSLAKASPWGVNHGRHRDRPSFKEHSGNIGKSTHKHIIRTASLSANLTSSDRNVALTDSSSNATSQPLPKDRHSPKNKLVLGATDKELSTKVSHQSTSKAVIGDGRGRYEPAVAGHLVPKEEYPDESNTSERTPNCPSDPIRRDQRLTAGESHASRRGLYEWTRNNNNEIPVLTETPRGYVIPFNPSLVPGFPQIEDREMPTGVSARRPVLVAEKAPPSLPARANPPRPDGVIKVEDDDNLEANDSVPEETAPTTSVTARSRECGQVGERAPGERADPVYMVGPTGQLIKIDLQVAAQSDVKPPFALQPTPANLPQTRFAPVQPILNVSPIEPQIAPEAKEAVAAQDDAPSNQGMNIPVGIAFARKRGERVIAEDKTEDTEDSSSGREDGDDTDMQASRADHCPLEEHDHRQHVFGEQRPLAPLKTSCAAPLITPNKVAVAGGAGSSNALGWTEEDTGSATSNQAVGAAPWLQAGGQPSLGPAAMWLGQGPYGIPPPLHPSSLDPSHLPGPPPTGLKLAQDPMTGQVYVIPEVPLEAGRLWPAGFPPPHQSQAQLHLLTQQLQHLQQQHVAVRAQQGPIPPPQAAVAPQEQCKSEEDADQEKPVLQQYQQYQQLPQVGAMCPSGPEDGITDAEARKVRAAGLQAASPGQLGADMNDDIAPGQLQPRESQTPRQLPPAQLLQQTPEGPPPASSYPYLVGLPGLGPGQTPFTALTYPPHMSCLFDSNLVQQLRSSSVTAEVSMPPRTEPPSVQSRGTSPLIFPEDPPIDAGTEPVAMVSVVTATDEEMVRPATASVSIQTHLSPVLEPLHRCTKEQGAQTSDVEEPVPALKVEKGIQSVLIDSDSDSNCALTMPLLTARTVDCSTQADGESMFSSRVSVTNFHYDSDRRSASPLPPALVAEGLPRDQRPAQPEVSDPELEVSDSETTFRLDEPMGIFGAGSTDSSCQATPTKTASRSKGLLDLDMAFLDRQILEASDGLDLLSTLAERAPREELKRGATQEEDNKKCITDSSVSTVLPDINKNYNVPRKSVFSEGSYSDRKEFNFGSRSPSVLRKDSGQRFPSASLGFAPAEEHMDAIELEMRMRLAELQRKYKEKQRELAKLQPRREKEWVSLWSLNEEKQQFKRGPGRPRKRKFRKASKLDSPSKSPRSDASPSKVPFGLTSGSEPAKKKKKDGSSESKMSTQGFLCQTPPAKSKSSDGRPSSSKKSSTGSKRRTSTPGGVSGQGSSVGGGKSKSSTSKSKSASKSNSQGPASSKSQSKRKSSSQSKRKIKKEETDYKEMFSEDSEIEDVSWLFDEDEINPPSLTSPAKKVIVKESPKHSEDTWTQKAPTSSSHADTSGASSPAAMTAARSPYSATESYSDYTDESGLGLLARYATSEVKIMCTSVAAATSAALKSKKRKKRPDGMANVEEAPVKKRKPGRPKKCGSDLSAGMTETIVDKKTKNMGMLHINTSSATNSNCGNTSSSSSSSSGSSGGGSSGVPKRKSKLSTPSKQSSKAESGGMPFRDEQWNIRRSERIFLNEPGLHSPTVPDAPPVTKTLLSPAKPLPEPVAVPAPTPPVITPVKPSKPTKTTPSVLALKTKCANKIKGKMKTMHDLSQKVKKKYSKSSKSAHKSSSVKAFVPTITPTEPVPCELAAPPAASSSSKVKYEQVYSDTDTDSSSDGDNVPLSTFVEKTNAPEPRSRSCVINKDDLKEGFRVLLYMEGLFYEGQVQGIQPPDVYGVVIDGERRSRPHILSQEELLNEAILDVRPHSTQILPEGTRVCAYWSQQFSCLYPGTIAKASPNPAVDKTLISVEFDDGDSGRIPLEHIRMLPEDYPIVNVSPSPVLVLGKRRRRTVSEELIADTKERKPSISDTLCSYQPSDDPRQRRRSGSRPARRKDDQETGKATMPTIDESESQQKLDVVDEYDAQGEFGPSTGQLTLAEPKPVLQLAELAQVHATPTGSNTKKKHKHKEKKKDKDKSRKDSLNGDDHKHKHHHHHHHHHKKRKDKHRKSADSNGCSSSKVTGSSMATHGGPTYTATIISPNVPEGGSATTNTMATSPMATIVTSPTSTSTSPGTGEKKLTVKIRTNSTDTLPRSPGFITEEDLERSKVLTVEKTHSSCVQEKSDNFSEDDSLDTPSDEDGEDEENDTDFTDMETATENNRQSNKSTTTAANKKNPPSSMSSNTGNKKPTPKRQTSVENKSKMAAFLPARQLWRWSGTSTKRPGLKGKAKKEFYRAITRGKEIIRVGDCAVFLSTGRPHLPYVGRIESLWEGWGGNMVVKVKWFYHPEETKGGKRLLEMQGALYQSPHGDENDVQTISHRCEVMRYGDYSMRRNQMETRGQLADFDNGDIYYLAGTYDPAMGVITFEADVRLIGDVK